MSARSGASGSAIIEPMPSELPLSSATMAASFLVILVFMCTWYDLPLGFESAQYFVPCTVMLSWHNGLRQWNSDTCDTFWLLVKP